MEKESLSLRGAVMRAAFSLSTPIMLTFPELLVIDDQPYGGEILVLVPGLVHTARNTRGARHARKC